MCTRTCIALFSGVGTCPADIPPGHCHPQQFEGVMDSSRIPREDEDLPYLRSDEFSLLADLAQTVSAPTKQTKKGSKTSKKTSRKKRQPDVWVFSLNILYCCSVNGLLKIGPATVLHGVCVSL